MSGEHKCPHCGKVCVSDRGVSQHMSRVTACLKAECAAVSVRELVDDDGEQASIFRSRKCRKKREEDDVNMEEFASQNNDILDEESEEEDLNTDNVVAPSSSTSLRTETAAYSAFWQAVIRDMCWDKPPPDLHTFPQYGHLCSPLIPLVLDELVVVV